MTGVSNRVTKIALVTMVLIVALTALFVLHSGNNMGGSAGAAPCVDSDSGLIFDVKGSTLLGTKAVEDMCINGTRLREYYCSPAGDRTSKIHDCQAQCLDGACAGGEPCSNGVKDGSESDVDCGGMICGKCDAARACAAKRDCWSNNCVNNLCQVASCSDRIKNQDETDIDCGGSSCSKCPLSKRCDGSGDCASGSCVGSRCVVAGSCVDGIKNQDETDKDCGGLVCPKCVSGKVCLAARDCISRSCISGVCQASSCTDKVKNGLETDKDCGGPSCPKCVLNKVCLESRDCQSGDCAGNNCVTPGTCSDGVKNQDETDLDCGGTRCTKCQQGQSCIQKRDCVINSCVERICKYASCTDGVRNQGETDIDCGGPSCAKCLAGKKCQTEGDCATNYCAAGLCQVASCGDQAKNGLESDVDCGGPNCLSCALGKTCAESTDCTSGSCLNGICRTPGTCGDQIKNQDESDVDCGGVCPYCSVGSHCRVNSDCISYNCEAGTCQPPGEELVVDRCYELYPGHNRLDENRVNVVFAGYNFADWSAVKTDAKKAVDLRGELNGKSLMELSVFKDNRDKFNFWYVKETAPEPTAGCTKDARDGCLCADYCYPQFGEDPCPDLDNQYLAMLCNIKCRGTAYFGWNSYNPHSQMVDIFAHEFLHQFPQFADEYTGGRNDWPMYPNCANSMEQAQQWWGDLVGQTCDNETTGFFPGCSYQKDNWRSTSMSIMKHQRYSRALGCPHIRRLEELLSNYGRLGGMGMGMTGAAVSDNAQKEYEQGVELELDPYTLEVLSVNPVSASVIQSETGGLTAEIEVAGRVFTQNFDTERVRIVEGDEETGAGARVDKVKKDRVKVRVKLPKDYRLDIKKNKTQANVQANGQTVEAKIRVKKSNKTSNP